MVVTILLFVGDVVYSEGIIDIDSNLEGLGFDHFIKRYINVTFNLSISTSFFI